MHAQSFVVGARCLENRADGILAKPRLANDGDVLEQGLAQLADISNIDALVSASAPLPVPDSPASRTTHRMIMELLSQLYADGALNKSTVETSLWERAAETERVTLEREALFVPLGDEAGHQHNWRPVFRLLIERLEQIAKKCERIVSRLKREPSTSTETLRTWQSSMEMLHELRTVLKSQLARQERLRRLYNKPANEPVEFATWTINQFANNPSKS